MESISLVQMGGINLKHFTEEHLLQVKPAWMTMIETAEIVAEHYGISPASVRTNMPCRASSAPLPRQAAGRYMDEIVALATKMKKVDKATGAESLVDITVDRDECNRPDTTLEGLKALKRSMPAASRSPRESIFRRQCVAVRRRRFGLRPDERGGGGGRI